MMERLLSKGKECHWRGLRSWLVFLCVNTILGRISVWSEIKKRKYVSILDVGCGEHSPLALIAKHYKFKVVGLDIFEPYLEETKNKGIYENVVLGDARYLPFKDRSFEAVTCIEVLEHVEKEDGEKIVNELERSSRWLVLLTTPIGKCAQHAYDGNPYQEHKYVWSLEELKSRGFKMVRGRGLKGMAGDRWRLCFPMFLRPLQYVGEIIGTLFSYFFPKIASSVIAWKEKGTS